MIRPIQSSAGPSADPTSTETDVPSEALSEIVSEEACAGADTAAGAGAGTIPDRPVPPGPSNSPAEPTQIICDLAFTTAEPRLRTASVVVAVAPVPSRARPASTPTAVSASGRGSPAVDSSRAEPTTQMGGASFTAAAAVVGFSPHCRSRIAIPRPPSKENPFSPRVDQGITWLSAAGAVGLGRAGAAGSTWQTPLLEAAAVAALSLAWLEPSPDTGNAAARIPDWSPLPVRLCGYLRKAGRRRHDLRSSGLVLPHCPMSCRRRGLRRSFPPRTKEKRKKKKKQQHCERQKKQHRRNTPSENVSGKQVLPPALRSRSQRPLALRYVPASSSQTAPATPCPFRPSY